MLPYRCGITPHLAGIQKMQPVEVRLESGTDPSMMEAICSKATNDGLDPLDPPAMPFLQMQNASNGCSTIDFCMLEGFFPRSVSNGTPAIWMRQFPGTVKAVWFNILPVGWIGDWHPSPSLQWVVPLSGRWFIETQDGVRVEMGAGDIHWGADIVTSADTSAEGHRSGQIGEVPCVQLMVQFDVTDDLDVVRRPG